MTPDAAVEAVSEGYIFVCMNHVSNNLCVSVIQVSEALDLTFAVAKRRMLPQELIGSHPYDTEALRPMATEATQTMATSYNATSHLEWHRLNQSAALK